MSDLNTSCGRNEPIPTAQSLCVALSELREQWAWQARGVRLTSDSESPAVKAFMACIGDLVQVIPDINPDGSYRIN